MENSENGGGEASPEKGRGGRPRIENLVPKLCHMDADDLQWAKDRYKGQPGPDGNKDSVDALLRRLLRAHRVEVENAEIIAQARKVSKQ